MRESAALRDHDERYLRTHRVSKNDCGIRYSQTRGNASINRTNLISFLNSWHRGGRTSLSR